jgi:hypothetical protein
MEIGLPFLDGRTRDIKRLVGFFVLALSEALGCNDIESMAGEKRAKCDNGDAKSVMMVVIPLFSSENSARMKVPRGTSKGRGALLRVRFSGSMGLPKMMMHTPARLVQGQGCALARPIQR